MYFDERKLWSPTFVKISPMLWTIHNHVFLRFSIVLHILLTLTFPYLYQLMYPTKPQALVNYLFWHPFLEFRQTHKSFFEKSDLFFICMLHPLSFDIQKQELEIEAAQV